MVPSRFLWKRILFQRGMAVAAFFLAGSISVVPRISAQAPPPRAAAPKALQAPAKPKLVVLLVVDQMRGDYVDKFLGQWTGGLHRRVEAFPVKARAAITMAGHKADAATWFDGGSWVTSSPYGTMPFIEEQAKSHPAKADFGKTWTLALPESAYWYGEKALGAVPPDGWDLTFPHPLRGKTGVGEPDSAFYEQWASSPYSDTSLTELAEKAFDALKIGNT